MALPLLERHVRGLACFVDARRVQGLVVRIVFDGHEAAFRVRHLAEVVLDELGKVSRRLDRVQGLRGAEVLFRVGIFAFGITERAGHVGGDGGVGSLLAGGEVVRGRVLLLLVTELGFEFFAAAFGFYAADFLMKRQFWRVIRLNLLTMRLVCSGVRAF